MIITNKLMVLNDMYIGHADISIAIFLLSINIF
jgi:hypothetical protein